LLSCFVDFLIYGILFPYDYIEATRKIW